MLYHSARGSQYTSEQFQRLMAINGEAFRQTAREMFPDIPGVVIAATGAFEKTDPGALEVIVALIEKATQLVRALPAEAARHVQAILGGA